MRQRKLRCYVVRCNDDRKELFHILHLTTSPLASLSLVINRGSGSLWSGYLGRAYPHRTLRPRYSLGDDAQQQKQLRDIRVPLPLLKGETAMFLLFFVAGVMCYLSPKPPFCKGGLFIHLASSTTNLQFSMKRLELSILCATLENK